MQARIDFRRFALAGVRMLRIQAWTIVTACPALIVFSAAWAQSYPTKPIRIMTSEVGGGADVLARTIARGISGPLGQQVFVDNRGGGVIPGETIAKSPGDGYNLLMNGGTLWFLPLLRAEVPYNVQRDFAPIAWISTSPAILVVHPSLPVKSVRELIALAKARPGELNYASAATGSINHLTAELFKSMARVNLTRIAYKGTGPALNDLIGGQVQLSFSAGAAMASHIKTGRLRALAVTSAQPSPAYPGLPTIAASGVPGYEAVSVVGMFAPARTPPAIIARLHQETAKVLTEPEIRERFLNAGVEVVGGTPEQLASLISTDIARWSKVIKDAGIHED